MALHRLATYRSKDTYDEEMITRAQEQDLWRRWSQGNDYDARDALIVAYRPLCQRIAKDYARKNSDWSLRMDLLQVAALAFAEYVDCKRFDPEMGNTIGTAARKSVEGEVLAYVRRNFASIKIGATKFEQSLFSNWGDLNRRALDKDPGMTTAARHKYIAEIMARDFNFPESKKAGPTNADRVCALECKMNSVFNSLSQPRTTAGADEANDGAWVDFIMSEYQCAEPTWTLEENDRERLSAHACAALYSLPERHREIVKALVLDEQPKTLHELASHYGISAERVRQIKVAALKKMQDYIHEHPLPSRTENLDLHA